MFIVSKRFQSTLPQGERPARLLVLRAPFWYFNPRSRKGSDGTRVQWIDMQRGFQSTLPQGERR